MSLSLHRMLPYINLVVLYGLTNLFNMFKLIMNLIHRRHVHQFAASLIHSKSILLISEILIPFLIIIIDVSSVAMLFLYLKLKLIDNKCSGARISMSLVYISSNLLGL